MHFKYIEAHKILCRSGALTIEDTMNRDQALQQQMDLMKSMMTQMQSLQANVITDDMHPSRRQYRRSQNSQSNRGNPNQCKYCWTHGWCNHYGRDCRTKADGHQDAATRENRMGGSTRNIPDAA